MTTWRTILKKISLTILKLNISTQFITTRIYTSKRKAKIDIVIFEMFLYSVFADPILSNYITSKTINFDLLFLLKSFE